MRFIVAAGLTLLILRLAMLNDRHRKDDGTRPGMPSDERNRNRT